MIGRIKGVLLEKQPPDILLDVAGIAYEVHTSMNTFYRLPELGHEIILHTHFVVREDAQQLFGFVDLSERSLFRTLLKVNGVGPRMALSILSSIEADQFVRCVADNDIATLVKLPGIGKKTAERLMIEMRDRLDDWQNMAATSFLPSSTHIAPTPHPKAATHEAISALISLGYKPPEASRAIAQLAVEGLSSAELIRLALKGMVKA